MISPKFWIMLCLATVLSIQLTSVFSVCLSKDQCEHVYGTTYNVIDSGAVLLDTQITPTVDLNPAPCCNLCTSNPNCSLYDIEFNDSNDAVCNIYSLPSSLLVQSEYFRFIQTSNLKRCIGFTKRYIENNI
jgi:hypothetical protein